MSWQDETCETCIYANGLWCRRFPPTVPAEGPVTVPAYPMVYGRVAVNLLPPMWQDACAEHKPREAATGGEG